MSTPIRQFSLQNYFDTALERIEHERDENGVIVASIPNAQGFYSQGDTFEEARSHLRDTIDAIVMFRLQLGWEIPATPSIYSAK